jgi:hypothetical protein
VEKKAVREELLLKVASAISAALSEDELVELLSDWSDLSTVDGIERLTATELFVRSPNAARSIYSDEFIATWIVGG